MFFLTRDNFFNNDAFDYFFVGNSLQYFLFSELMPLNLSTWEDFGSKTKFSFIHWISDIKIWGTFQ